MTREQLTALRDALTAVLGWPEPIRVEIMKWLSCEAAWSGNGLDHDPPPRVLSGVPPVRKTPRPANPRVQKPGGKTGTSFEAVRRAKLAEARDSEHKLLQAMADNPELSVVALANAAEASRSSTGERLRRLALAGKVEKDHVGRWKLKGEEPNPPQPSPS